MENEEATAFRKLKPEYALIASAPKSISSAHVGFSQHMEKRVLNPSNITNLPTVTSMADLDLFYTQEAKVAQPEVQDTSSATATPAQDMRTEPVGIAMFNDSESENDVSEDDEDDDWKYCQQASHGESKLGFEAM